MKASVVVFGLVCLAGAFVMATFGDLTGSGSESKSDFQTLPTSLDDLYPPKGPAPAYLLAMLDLARPFSGIVVDVQENDMANAMSNFKIFEKSYLKIAKMVPEWEQRYPLQPVEELAVAMNSGDPSKIMASVEKVDRVCHHCHLASMAAVEQKYRWGNFGDLVLTDPLSGQDVSYAKLMLMMQTNFTGIGVNLEQGQKENAMTQFAGFNDRFKAMADACIACHDSERKYFVDGEVVESIARLEQELSRGEINGDAIGNLMQSIGRESCLKCHLVHIPAAYAQQLSRAY